MDRIEQNHISRVELVQPLLHTIWFVTLQRRRELKPARQSRFGAR
jgi:hypothetical protein